MSHLINMMKQVKKIKNGVGVQRLLDEASKILGNPLVMFNTEYSLLAHTETVTNDPLWNEIVTTGTFCKETQRLFESEGFIEKTANTARPVLLSSEKLEYDRFSGKVFNKNNSHVSSLVIVACNKPFEDSDMMVFEVICKIISREISKCNFFQEFEKSHQDKVIRKLIDGKHDIKLDLGHVEIIYNCLETCLYVAAVSFCQYTPEYTDLLYFRNLFKQTKSQYKYTIYDNYIIIIISTNDDVLNVNKELKDLIKIFDQNNMYAGISSRFENLFELQKYYKEALATLQYAMDSRCSQRVFPCNPDSVNRMKKIEALSNGKGIKYFLNKGLEIFGNPLLFHDMELNLLAYTENTEITDPIWEELITYGTSSDETINLFKTEGFIGIMENTKGGAILIGKKIKFDRMAWRIYSNDNIMIGCLNVVNSMSQFTEDELILFGAFSQKFSKEVRKLEFYSNYGQLYSDTVINRLLSGKIDAYTFYSEDIGNLYDDLMDNLYLVVVDTKHCKSEHICLTYFRDLFNRLNTVNRYAIYENYIIVIISTDGTSLNDNDEFNEISKVFEQNNIYAGISPCFENIYDLQKYYVEASDALKQGLTSKDEDSKEHIFL